MQAETTYPSYHFATSALPEKIRREAFCDVIGRELLRITVDPARDRALDIDACFQPLHRAAVATGSLSPLKMSHIPALATDDDLILIILRRGSGRFGPQERAIELSGGQATVAANGAACSVETIEPIDMVNLRLERGLLTEKLKRSPERGTEPIPAGSPALQLLSGYLDAIEQTAKMDAWIAERVSAHLYDLAALVLGPTRDATEHARHGGVKAARLQAIKADIARRLNEPDLSVEALSKRHGVSERYVQMLFAGEGSTPSHYIAEQRIEQAHRMLLDPNNLRRPILDIAYAVGFSDVSYFNRLFRKQIGSTPRDVRSLAGWPIARADASPPAA
jgi:AraC-like DNA-binding protein